MKMKLKTVNSFQNTFDEMNLTTDLMTAMTNMGITQPTEIQSKAISVGMNGSDMIAIAQTGSGKTLAFALVTLMSLHRKNTSRALILVPSREMAQQIYKVFTKLNVNSPIDCCLIIGGIPNAKQITHLNKQPRLIIATPGRLNDHLIANKVLLRNVENVVIDEADRMLDMGFAPQLESIRRHLSGTRQTLMFSASFNPEVEEIALTFLNKDAFLIRTSQAEVPVEQLKQKILFIDKFAKNDRLLDELNATKSGVIVFTSDQHRCEFIGNYLEEYGFSSDIIHGSLTQGQRNRAIRKFREGETRILVATDLLARGLDVPHVDTVINFDFPYEAQDFLHRIGRTARAGRTGNAITFVTQDDQKRFKNIKNFTLGASEIKVNPQFEFVTKASRGKRIKDLKTNSKSRSK